MADADERDEPTTAEEPGDELEVRDEQDQPEEIDETKSAPEDRATAGPFDVSEVTAMRPYVDLGGIKVAPREGLQMRLDVDDRQKRVVAVTLTFGSSALQVQAYSAPKSLGLWHQIRASIAKQVGAQGSRTSEEDGPLGPELVVVSPVAADQGGGERTIRFVGVDGPRWIVRGAVMGAAATDASARERILELFRDLVIVRGDQPMPPNELLPLKVPAGAQQGGTAAPPAGSSGQSGAQRA